jgi:DNA uptake protein ComE-like DNA-binding protein
VETNGFIVLVPLMAIILFIPGVYVSLFSKEYNPNEEDLAVMDSLMTVWGQVVEVKAVNARVVPDPMMVDLHTFNPNTITVEGMATLGIPAFLSRRIDNYRAKGGQFRVKRDLARIYDFPDSLYQTLQAYIDLPEKRAVKKSNKQARGGSKFTKSNTDSMFNSLPKAAPLWVDLSTADTVALKKLRGIGPSFSRRIIKYRELLGGFAHKTQLKEVYGLTDSLYSSLSDQIHVSQPDSVTKISLNLANFKTLSSHPYISYKAAREILKLKSKRGKFRSLKDLMIVKELDSAKVMRLAPYVSF